jgi:hypothetical protein
VERTEKWKDSWAAEAASPRDRKNLPTFQTHASIPIPQGTRHFGGKKYTNEKLHFRSFLKV